MVTRLLGLDPGLRTGFALFEYGPRRAAELVESGDVPNGLDGFLEWWPTFRNGYQVDEVVCEKFIIDGTIIGTWSAQIEGALKALYDGPVTWHTRGDKAGLRPGEPQRRAWFRAAGIRFDSSHALDAATHAIVLLKRRAHMPTLERYWPKPAEA